MKFLFVNSAPIIRYGLGQGFKQAGETVKIINTALEYQKDKNFLSKLIDEFKPDFAVTEGGESLQNILFPALKEKGIKHIYWAIEDPPDFERLSLPFAKNSDYTFTPSQECIGHYKKHGIEAHLLMFACLPSFHKRVKPEKKYMHDIIFVGNNYYRHSARVWGREIILKPLIARNYNLKVYGNHWWLDPSYGYVLNEEFYGGYLQYEDLPTAYSSVKIVLGMHSVDTCKTMMSMRTYEVLGCGAFFLTQWTPAIENLFENHKHLVWSKSAEETVELVNYFLKHDQEREKIAKQGQEFVYKYHTYLHRANTILNVITGNKAGE